MKIHWDEGAAAKLDDAAIMAALEGAADEAGAVAKQAGDVAAVFAKTTPIEARYTCQLLAHATLEPQNCTARVGRDGVDVWASTQFPQGAQGVAAAAAGVKPEQVRIHAQFIGGGFGRRLDVDYVAQAVAIAKALPGTPVKLIWTREDDTRHDVYRPPSLHLMRGVVADGRLLALAQKMISPSMPSFAMSSSLGPSSEPPLRCGRQRSKRDSKRWTVPRPLSEPSGSSGSPPPPGTSELSRPPGPSSAIRKTPRAWPCASATSPERCRRWPRRWPRSRATVATRPFPNWPHCCRTAR